MAPSTLISTENKNKKAKELCILKNESNMTEKVKKKKSLKKGAFKKFI